MEIVFPGVFLETNAMAEIIIATTNTPKRKLHSLKIEMTPMVDLGFLLITFFIFTTSMAEQKGIQLIMPPDGKSSDLPASAAFSVLVGRENELYFYEGKWDDAFNKNLVRKTSYDIQNGLGKHIRNKMKESINAKNKLMLLIKPGKDAT
jgi:biopolymer transport protein ExbD